VYEDEELQRVVWLLAGEMGEHAALCPRACLNRRSEIKPVNVHLSRGAAKVDGTSDSRATVHLWHSWAPTSHQRAPLFRRGCLCSGFFSRHRVKVFASAHEEIKPKVTRQLSFIEKRPNHPPSIDV
jgi:hypothetical protein